MVKRTAAAADVHHHSKYLAVKMLRQALSIFVETTPVRS
jgi:hypothetical protein